MKLNKQTLLDSIQQELQTQIAFLEEKIIPLSPEEQLWTLGHPSWSLVDCIEHLNNYGAFYLPNFEAQLAKNITSEKTEYKTGRLGDYFANSMLPKEGKITNKMKTFKKHNPVLEIRKDRKIEPILTEHLNQQKRLQKIIEQSAKHDFNKLKVPTMMGNWLKINYGDGLRFYFNHLIRHYLQLRNIKQAYQQSVHAEKPV